MNLYSPEEDDVTCDWKNYRMFNLLFGIVMQFSRLQQPRRMRCAGRVAYLAERTGTYSLCWYS